MEIILDDGSVLPDVAYLTSAQLGRPFRVQLGRRCPSATGRPPRSASSSPTAGHPRQEVRGRLRHRQGRRTSSTASPSTPATCRPTRSSTTAWSGSTTTPTRPSRWSPTSRTRRTPRPARRPRYDGMVFDGPDNVTVTPWGTLVLAEDGVGASHVLSSVPGGPTYAIARNQLNIGTDGGAGVLRVHRADVLRRRQGAVRQHPDAGHHAGHHRPVGEVPRLSRGPRLIGSAS